MTNVESKWDIYTHCDTPTHYHPVSSNNRAQSLICYGGVHFYQFSPFWFSPQTNPPTSVKKNCKQNLILKREFFKRRERHWDTRTQSLSPHTYLAKMFNCFSDAFIWTTFYILVVQQTAEENFHSTSSLIHSWPTSKKNLPCRQKYCSNYNRLLQIVVGHFIFNNFLSCFGVYTCALVPIFLSLCSSPCVCLCVWQSSVCLWHSLDWIDFCFKPKKTKTNPRSMLGLL